MKPISAGSYSIYFENKKFSALNRFLKQKKFSHYFILCDENTIQNCVPQLISAVPALAKAHLIETESGEAAKSLEIAVHIWNCLLEEQADRESVLIHVGGGVICDLGGFCASVFKRGIPFIHLPTTVLAMADASIGTKTAIDFEGIKNTIGTFAAPEAVFIAPHFLHTLPQRHLLNGLAEIYKIALVADRRFWSRLQGLQMNELIYQSVLLKTKIVKRDPLEKNLRKVLNFGHSIGHALEAFLLAEQLDILHGEAVVAGMIMETHVAWQKKLIPASLRDEIVFVLSSWFDLPAFGFDFQQLEPFLRHDKKNKNGELKLALLRGAGQGVPASTCTPTQIKKAIAFYKNCLDA